MFGDTGFVYAGRAGCCGGGGRFEYALIDWGGGGNVEYDACGGFGGGDTEF